MAAKRGEKHKNFLRLLLLFAAMGALKTRFIVNPRSGRAQRALPAVRAFAAARGAEVVLTERSRHASELAARALDHGVTLVVAVGGDGTMNEIASVLTGSAATLGLVPCGSGDGLGRHLGVHGTVAHALAILENGTPSVIDTATADGHPFFTASGIGFEAEIGQRFNQLQRRGFFRYLTTGAKAFRAWQAEDYTVHCAAEKISIRAFTLAVGNANQYGNDAFIAPGASVTDGLIDLCAVRPVTLWNAVPLLAQLFRGTLTDGRDALLRRAPRFVVERPAPGLLHTDGEIHSAGTAIEFVARPASLRIMCPK